MKRERTFKEGFSKREQQIMDILYGAPDLSAAEIQEKMSDAPSYSAVRALLAILLEKGHVQFRKEGNRYIYSAAQSRKKAGNSALKKVLRTFYNGSLSQAVAGLLDTPTDGLSKEEIERLSELVNQLKEKER